MLILCLFVVGQAEKERLRWKEEPEYCWGTSTTSSTVPVNRELWELRASLKVEIEGSDFL